MASPKISVVMSVYNGAQHLREAIDSVLGQSLEDFEFIIVNDGSTDESEKIIKSYTDKRIKLISRDNRGLVASLNEAVGQARGQYIARQDADDISKPERLRAELDILEARPEVVIVGSSIETIDASGKKLNEHRVLLNNPELKQELMVRSPFAHGSVMFQRTAFERAGGYQAEEWPAEDYGLWLRLATQGDFANLDEPLYAYREHGEGISGQNLTKQEQQKRAVQSKAWKQRKTLLSQNIKTADYLSLDMGQQRIERIAHNLLFALRKALLRGRLIAFLITLKILLGDRSLRRKCARLVLVKLRLKHV
jgi:glycosyltransferase involved in cell wall biosynthesis